MRVPGSHWRNPLPWRIIGYLFSGHLSHKAPGGTTVASLDIRGTRNMTHSGWILWWYPCCDASWHRCIKIKIYIMWLCDYVLDMWRAKFVCVCMTSLFLLVAFGWYCSSFSFGWLDNIISCHTGFLKISNRNRSSIIATTPDPLTPQNNPVSLLCRAAI